MRSLVLISSSPALPGDRSLPPPTAEFTAFFATAEVDWSDAGSVTEYTVAFTRMLAGAERPFDEAAMRARPLGHRADEIPAARLLALDGAGHGVYRDDWETLARAIAQHTS